ncbi:hypothetical protein BK797_04020 [Kosakonia sacchari]|nr:hypothetical protein BK797_04020 [Kosakonia sacchari]
MGAVQDNNKQEKYILPLTLVNKRIHARLRAAPERIHAQPRVKGSGMSQHICGIVIIRTHAKNIALSWRAFLIWKALVRQPLL